MGNGRQGRLWGWFAPYLREIIKYKVPDIFDIKQFPFKIIQLHNAQSGLYITSTSDCVPCFYILTEWLMIACIALFSAPLSILTALACGSTWVTSFMKLQPSRCNFCVHHTTMYHVTSCKATYVKCMRNLPPALLAEWPGSFTCYCGNTGWNGYRNKSQHRKLTLEKKILNVVVVRRKRIAVNWCAWVCKPGQVCSMFYLLVGTRVWDHNFRTLRLLRCWQCRASIRQ